MNIFDFKGGDWALRSRPLQVGRRHRAKQDKLRSPANPFRPFDERPLPLGMMSEYDGRVRNNHTAQGLIEKHITSVHRYLFLAAEPLDLISP
jgi:hypothetical protein